MGGEGKARHAKTLQAPPARVPRATDFFSWLKPSSKQSNPIDTSVHWFSSLPSPITQDSNAYGSHGAAVLKLRAPNDVKRLNGFSLLDASVEDTWDAAT